MNRPAVSPPLRLDQLLSRFGYCSRREASAWARAGRVTLDGSVVTRPDQRLDPAAVRVDGQPVEFPYGLLVAFHKPAGCVCSHNPAEGPLIYDLIPDSWMRRQPAPVTIGRLDKETTGLILITDDGALVHEWTSPRHEVVKTYEVTVDRDLPGELADIFASGQLLLRGESKPCLPAELQITGSCSARLHIREGKYHQVRRMFASQGYTVTALHRTRVGEVELGNLAPGEWRECGVQITDADPQGADALMLLRESSVEARSLYPDVLDPNGPWPVNPPTPARGVYLVAYVQGKPVASGALRPLTDDAVEIRRMFVTCAFRRRGMASAILRELETRAASLGYSIMRLETGNRQLPAIALYQRCGFVRIEPFGVYANDPLSVCFEKPVAPHAP